MSGIAHALVCNEIDEPGFGDGGALPSAKLGFSQTGGAGSSNAANRHAAMCAVIGAVQDSAPVQ